MATGEGWRRFVSIPIKGSVASYEGLASFRLDIKSISSKSSDLFNGAINYLHRLLIFLTNN